MPSWITAFPRRIFGLDADQSTKMRDRWDVDADIERIDWMSSKQKESVELKDLEELYHLTAEWIRTYLRWYDDNMKRARANSFVFRVALVLLLAAGILTPIVALATPLDIDAETQLALTSIGLVALALAGIIYVAANVFGISNQLQRYMKAKMSIEDVLMGLHLDWAITGLTARVAPLTPEEISQIVGKFRASVVEARAAITTETDLWQTTVNEGLDKILARVDAVQSEVRANSSAIKADVTGEKDEMNAQFAVGAIDISIVNMDRTEGPIKISVKMADREEDVQEINDPNSSVSVPEVPSGLRLVRLTGNLKGDKAKSARPLNVSKTVVVSPGQVAKVIFDVSGQQAPDQTNGNS